MSLRLADLDEISLEIRNSHVQEYFSEALIAYRTVVLEQR
jgi:hypothetical protein